MTQTSEIDLEITCRFDPFDCGCEDTAACFRDDIARTFYLLWRRNHIVDQHFPGQVLSIALGIRSEKPQTAEELRQTIRKRLHYRSGVSSADVDRWCEEAMPYFRGEKTVGYKVLE